jgi:cyanophycinase-like exopeptidase
VLLLAACPGSPTDESDAGPNPAADSGAAADSGPQIPEECADLGTGLTLGALGGTENTETTAISRLVLMGGGPEVDEASRIFVEGASGGEVLVLRASGSVDSYTPYFYEELGADPAPASVKTIRIDDPAAGSDDALICHVLQADALWLAGGDQWDYLGLWPAELHAQIAGVGQRGAAMGGTSAGAMSLSEVAFDAEEGSITSPTALATPDHFAITLSLSPFVHPALIGMVVDTHFSEREREGRLLAFLARGREMLSDSEGGIWGVGIDEHTALIIEEGTFRVHDDSSGAVHLYHFNGDATVAAGSALSMDGVQALSMPPGTQGPWPPSPQAAGFEPLAVVDGEIIRP